MSTSVTFPSNWTAMTSKQVGSKTRDTSEPGGSRLQFFLDVGIDGIIDNPMTFDFIDISLPSLSATAYSTQILAQKKWATQGVSRIIQGDAITGTIECSSSTYQQLMAVIGAHGTARIEIPNQGWFSQWRVALLNVDGPSLVDGDRMTGSLSLTVTNTAPDYKSEMAPVFGDFTGDITYEEGPEITIGAGG